MLSNETILITGANSGIGLSFVKKLIKNNQLYCVDINTNRLSDIQNKDNLNIIQGDLSNYSSRKDLMDKIKNINVTTLINNVGIGYWGLLENTNIDKLHKIIQVNIVTMVDLSHFVLKKMKLNNYGRIINVSSTGAYCGASNSAVYTGTKAFVQNFSEALDMECFNTNVNIFTLYPGATDTNFWEDAGTKNTKMFKKVKLRSADNTVDEFLNGIINNKKNIVSGLNNKIMVFFSKFIARDILKKLAFKKYK